MTRIFLTRRRQLEVAAVCALALSLAAIARAQLVTAPSLIGTQLTAVVSSSEVRVNEARVTKADTVATNGVVHAIDAVILPKDWRLLAAAA